MNKAHHRFAVAILALLVLPVPACSSRQSSQVEEAKVPAEVEVAKEVYADTVAEAKATLLKAFDDKIKKVAATGDLDAVKAAQAAKAKVGRGNNLSESHPMRKHQMSFNEKILLANKTLAMALDSAVKKYTMDLQIILATAVQVELNNLLVIIKADETIEIASRKIALNPDDATAWTARAASYALKGNYDQAIKDFSEAIKLKPEDFKTWGLRGRAYFQNGNLDQAIRDLSEAIKLNPDDPDAWSLRGKVYYAKGNYDQAIKDFSEAIKLNPEDFKTWGFRGAIYFKKGNTAKAEADFKKAEELKAKAKGP